MVSKVNRMDNKGQFGIYIKIKVNVNNVIVISRVEVNDSNGIGFKCEDEGIFLDGWL